MEINKFVGHKIRQFREEKRMSQEIIARRLRTTRQTISRYETGERKVSQEALYELAKIFDKKMDAFFPERKENISKEQAMTIAAHLDDDVTDEEMRDILAYIEMKKKLHRGE